MHTSHEAHHHAVRLIRRRHRWGTYLPARAAPTFFAPSPADPHYTLSPPRTRPARIKGSQDPSA
eukprot:11931128-Prorocentrum_lima.AAC.1